MIQNNQEHLQAIKFFKQIDFTLNPPHIPTMKEVLVEFIKRNPKKQGKMERRK
jgi:hypothetical protein